MEIIENIPAILEPEDIARQMAIAKDADEAKIIGIKIAQRVILEAKALDKVKGIYVMPPFTKEKYAIAVDVLEVLR